MAKIILVRHGRTEWNSQPRFHGRGELALSQAGVEQARATSRRINSSLGWKASVIYTSPMRRCVRTAQIIADPLSLPVQCMESLNDIDYGEWEGLSAGEVKARWPDQFETWCHEPHLTHVPGGETLTAVFLRACAALDEIVRAHPWETVVVIGHNSVNRLILLHALGLPIEHYPRFMQDMCGISEIDCFHGKFFIKTINETYHLKGCVNGGVVGRGRAAARGHHAASGPAAK